MIECSVCGDKIPNHAICLVEIYIPNEYRMKQYICGFCMIPIRNALKNKKKEESSVSSEKSSEEKG